MDILSLTAVELAKAIREGKTTAVEATQAVLDRIAAAEDVYHCYVTVTGQSITAGSGSTKENRSGRTDRPPGRRSFRYQR